MDIWARLACSRGSSNTGKLQIKAKYQTLHIQDKL